jgi:hypothetical protein
MMRTAIVLAALAACHHDAGLPATRPADFAITVLTGDGSGMRPGHAVHVSSSGGVVELATAPRTIVARFTPSPAQLDALYAAYVTADLEHAAPAHRGAADEATIQVDAIVDGRLIRFSSDRPHAQADAIAAMVDAMAPPYPRPS